MPKFMQQRPKLPISKAYMLGVPLTKVGKQGQDGELVG